MASSELKAEIRRKIFHLTGMLIPGIYGFIPKTSALWILGMVCLGYFFLELNRKLIPEFNLWYTTKMKPLLRESEHHSIAGTVQFLSGCWLTIFLFDKPVAMTAIYMFIWGDLVAAIIGKSMGVTKIIFNKTLEGTFAGLCAFILVAYVCKITILNPMLIATLCITSVIGTILELFSKGNWDNFSVPIGIGLSLSYLPIFFY